MANTIIKVVKVLKMISEKRQSLILQELKKKIFITPRVN